MKLTKLRFAALLVAFSLGVPALAVAVSPFVDVVPGAFYEAPVNWAATNGITTGTDNTHFAPNDPVTRGQSVTFLKRYDDFIVQPANAALGTRIGGVEASVANLGQTVGTLNCNTSQVARWDGTSWVCNTISLATRYGVDSISTLDIPFTVGAYTSIAIGADNLPIISYYDPTQTSLKVLHCQNIACASGSSTTTLDASGSVGKYTSIAIGADNLPIISYYDSTNTSLKVLHCTSTGCTGGATVTVDSVGDVGGWTSIAIGADNLPIISYQDIGNGDLKVVHCTSMTCATHDVPVNVDSAHNGGSYTSIAIGADGVPVISYHDSINSGLRVARCARTDCTTGAGTRTTINAGGRYSSIAIGADNLPIISYNDNTTSKLKAFHCVDRSCTAGSSSTLDADGLYTSIAIGADGLPIISYYDNTNKDLKLFGCTNTACSAGAAIALDTAGDTGGFTSMRIGADNQPIVSYYNFTNGDLKVTHVASVAAGITFG